MMPFNKLIATAAITASFGAAAVGLHAAPAHADPDWGPDIPWIPGPGHWVSDVDLWPGPGDIAKWCPGHSPPGHWIGGPHGIPCT